MNALDLLQEVETGSIDPFIRPVHYVPSTMSIETLLSDFRDGAGTIAVVVDEHGDAVGIVMLEDILEVIVGELEDEFDGPEAPDAGLRKLGDRDYLAGAHIELERLKLETGLDIPIGDYGTLAGFLIGIEKEIPPPGAVIRFRNISFHIERGTRQAAQEIRIRW